MNTKILRELERDGRISNTDLADKVGLSASACLRRVQELERKKIISGYRAVINREALGSSITIFVLVCLSKHQQKDLDAFEKAVRYAPEIKGCHKVTGTIEYILRVEARDFEHYKKFHSDTLCAIPNIASVVTSLSMDAVKDEYA